MLEGDWQILVVDYAGEPMPGRTGKLRITGSRFALQIGGAPREVGQVEWDASGQPAKFDLVWREPGGGEARRIRAIVRVRGQLMQFCYYPETGLARPVEFASTATETSPPAILVRCRRES